LENEPHATPHGGGLDGTVAKAESPIVQIRTIPRGNKAIYDFFIKRK